VKDEGLVRKVVDDAVREIRRALPPERRLDDGPEAVLFGPSGALDSLELVHLIVLVEQGIEDALGVRLVLADEKALSRSRSPFRNIEALAGYVSALLSERGHG